MIYMYTGTPGAGKSLHVAKEIRDHLRFGAFVISNFPINVDKIRLHKNSSFLYLDNAFLLDPGAPAKIQQMFQEHRKEHDKTRCLLVLDECQLLFDSRQWDRPGRTEWLAFFTLHRHVMRNRKHDGTIILVTQNEKAIDKRLLPLSEYYVAHRNLKYGSMSEFLLSLLFGCNLFVQRTVWRPGKEKVSAGLFVGTRKLFELYDTSLLFATDDGEGQPEG